MNRNLILLTLFIFSFSAVKAQVSSVPTLRTFAEEKVYGNTPDGIDDFTFDELLYLSKTAEPKGAVKDKLDQLLNKTYVFNTKFDATLDKQYLRVLHWNIERGFHIDDAIDLFTNPKKYRENYYSNLKSEGNKFSFDDELSSVKDVDVISLNELDIGMPRTEYENVINKFSNALGWNYVYINEFVEVGPLFQGLEIDRDKYRGLHGNAIVSKFPIVNARVIRLPDTYDWYKAEVKRESPVEYIRKFGALAIFRQSITKKEVRHGGRAALLAEIKLPDGKIVTVVSTHLEDRTYPDLRLNQLKALLEVLKNIETPLILTGDFNTSTTDTRPTSVNKEIFKRLRDQDFIIRTAVATAVPGVPIGAAFGAVAVSKLLQYHDPFFRHIPVVFPNHERGFYNVLKKFTFADGEGFDFSGDKFRSFGRKKGLLANSNQRHWKGFKSTYKLEEPRVIAYFKLDWFFIKPKEGLFRPFNGRSLISLNKAKKGGVSDHMPITVDIELENGIAEEEMLAKYKDRIKNKLKNDSDINETSLESTSSLPNS